MSVDYVVTINFYFITSNFFFRNCINNFLSICILRKIAKYIVPIIFFCYSGCLYDFTICKKIYRNAFRANTILVISVFPCLASFNIYALIRNVIDSNFNNFGFITTVYFDFIQCIIIQISLKCSYFLDIVYRIKAKPIFKLSDSVGISYSPTSRSNYILVLVQQLERYTFQRLICLLV